MSEPSTDLDLDLSQAEVVSSRVDPRLIQELFDKDPLELSSQDLDIIIADFRQQRIDYMQPAEAKPKKTSARSKASGPTVEVSDDLLRDLLS